jgi:hypothetical protein
VVWRPRPARVRREATNGLTVRGERPAGTARTSGGVRPGRTPRSLGVWAHEEGAAWDGGLPRPAWPRARTPRGRGRRGAGRHEILLLVPCLSTHNSKFLNRNVPTDEYESCRSSYYLPLSKRLYSVLLNRFCKRGLSTLNVTQLP